MNELFKLTVSLSLSGSVLILLLLLAGPLLRNRVSKRWQYYIWLLVAARLLLPLGPEGGPAGEAVASMEAAAVSVAGSVPRQGAADTDPAFEAETAAPEPSALQAFGTAVLENLWVVWLAGALAMLIRRATAYQSFVRYIRAGWEPVDDPALLDRVAELGAEIGVKRPVELYAAPMAASPMLIGFCKPAIVLPTVEMPEEDLRFVLLHELTHCRRQDVLYKWLLQLTVCVHWFNPLVHWMRRECERLGELSCDEAVLKRLDEAGRRAYGSALLRTMAAGGGYKAATPSITLGESGELLKERLDMIMKFKKPGKLAAVLSMLLAMALGATAVAAGTYTGAVTLDAPEEYGEYVGVWRSPAVSGTRYTMDAYYQEPYMFEIAWNCVPQEHSVEAALPDGGKMTVWLTATTAAVGLEEDEEALKALSAVIARLWKETKDSEFPLTSPMVFYYQHTGISSAAEMAETYYKGNDLAMFKAAFAMLDGTAQAKWVQRICADNNIAFFSVALDGADGALIQAAAEKAYADGSFAYFSVAADRMSEEQLRTWLARSKEERNAGFQSILMRKLGWENELEKLEETLDKEQAEAYRAVGVTVEGKNYYYQGQLVNIFLDHRADSSFYTLDMNPRGSVNIKILRDKDNKITGVAYLTQEEITELFGDMEDPDD